MTTQRFKISETTELIQNPVYGNRTKTTYKVTRRLEAKDLETGLKYTEEVIDTWKKEGIGNFGEFTNKTLAEMHAQTLNLKSDQEQNYIIFQTENS